MRNGNRVALALCNRSAQFVHMKSTKRQNLGRRNDARHLVNHLAARPDPQLDSAALRKRGATLIANGERQSGAALLDLADTLDRAREVGRRAKRGQIAFQRGRQ